MNLQLANNIRFLRIHRGFTRSELIERAPILTKETLSTAERLGEIDHATLAQIAITLGVPPKSLADCKNLDEMLQGVTLKQRITAYVEGRPGGYTAIANKAKVGRGVIRDLAVGRTSYMDKESACAVAKALTEFGY